MEERKRSGRGDKNGEKLSFPVSVLIPVTGQKTINETIESVIHQECAEWEVLILRNDIHDLPQGTDVAEKDVFYQDSDYLIREIYIRKKGKGECLECRDLLCKKRFGLCD